MQMIESGGMRKAGRGGLSHRIFDPPKEIPPDTPRGRWGASSKPTSPIPLHNAVSSLPPQRPISTIHAPKFAKRLPAQAYLQCCRREARNGRRVASLDTWVAYAPQLEDTILPQAPDVLKGILELAAY